MISTVSVPDVALLNGLDSLLVAAGVGPFLSTRTRARLVVLLGGLDALASAAGAFVPVTGIHQVPYRFLVVVYFCAVGLIVLTRRGAPATLPLAVLAAVLAVDNLSTGLPGVPGWAVPAVSLVAGCWSAGCAGVGLALACRATADRRATVLGAAAVAAGVACLALGQGLRRMTSSPAIASSRPREVP